MNDTPAENLCLEMVGAELANAKQKHPHFIDSFAPKAGAGRAEYDLKGLRDGLQWAVDNGCVEFRDVFDCEMLEALVAFKQGDLAHARQELAQCAAVCIRGMEFLTAEIEKGGDLTPRPTA